ncbi:MAG: hypothetical protein WAK96_04395 [Desulfobaccales bacterium]
MASMEEPAVYKLYLSPALKLAIAFMFLALAGAAFALLVLPLKVQTHKGPSPLFVAFLLGIICLSLFSALRLPHRITLAPDGAVEFRSILRTWVVRAGEIRSIKPSARLGFFVVRTDGARIRLLPQFDNFHDFLTRLQALNPRVELRGC